MRAGVIAGEEMTRLGYSKGKILIINHKSLSTEKRVKVFKEFKRENERRKMEMKIMNITDIDGFFKVIDSCSGKVELISTEGDRLNLKSKLSQYVAFAKVFSDSKIDELEIIAYEPQDIERLVEFMYAGK